MIELDKRTVMEELSNTIFAKEFSEFAGSILVRGFQDRRFFPESLWYIASVPPITREQFEFYHRFVARYFGQPVKDYGVPTIPGENIPNDIIPIVNRMNGFLMLGIAFINGILTLDQIAQVLNAQQGACTNPPVNLGNEQALYLRKSTDKKATELVRTCPHLSERGNKYTIEYMLHKTR